MAPKRNFRFAVHTTNFPFIMARPSALIACIAVISMLAFLTTDVSACNCFSLKVDKSGARCYRYWNRQGQYWNLPVGDYPISCQRHGDGNSWWYYVKLPSGSYCYVNDYYGSTGCATKCVNPPICPV